MAAALRKLAAHLDDSGSQGRTSQEVGDGALGVSPSLAFVFSLLPVFFSHFGAPEMKFFLSFNWGKGKI